MSRILQRFSLGQLLKNRSATYIYLYNSQVKIRPVSMLKRNLFMSNPLLTFTDLPPFSAIKPEHVK
ncbi:hypothetical protein, partial [Klebsiella pneumoniae]